jgi:hypothetical protein
MCIVGGSRDVSPVKSAFGVVATALGIAAFVLIVLGLITGSESVLLVLAGVIGFLWFITTLRHASFRQPRCPSAGEPATFEQLASGEICARRSPSPNGYRRKLGYFPSARRSSP